MVQFSIIREIGIDAAHRIPLHGSKCRNLHGHRYTIQAICVGDLASDGEQSGMVLDFGFLKEEMMREIDGPCDHGLILCRTDPLLEKLLSPPALASILRYRNWVAVASYWFESTGVEGIDKLYVIDSPPTAENLARHWFLRLASRVVTRSNGIATLKSVKVWETPNCCAEYPA